jgi:integrase
MARRSCGDGQCSSKLPAAAGWARSTSDATRRRGSAGAGRSARIPRPAAKELHDPLREEKRNTGTVGRRDITVETIVRDLLANPPAEWTAPSTFQVNTDLCERIIAELGRQKVVKLTPGEVEWLLNRVAREGLSTRSIGGAKGLLARAIGRAQRDGLVGRNVAALAETPRGTRKESSAMTLEQIRVLFASGLTPWWRAYLMTGILCGLRPGELAGLTWDDVDFAAGAVRVRHSLKEIPIQDPAPGQPKTVLRLEALKTERSRRTLQLPARVAEALRALRAAQAAELLRLGRYHGTMNLVFGTGAGLPRRRQDIAKGLKRVCANAGLGSDWHPHEQRHTFVSVLSDAGVGIELIAEATGHINPMVTREVYRHQIADKVARAPTTMDQVFGTGSTA